MKKLEYHSKKWNKRIDSMNEKNEISFWRNEIAEIKQKANDVIHEQMMFNNSYILLAKCEYLNKDYTNAVNSWNLCIDCLIEAFKLEGTTDTSEAVKINLKRAKQKCGEVYIAYVLNRFKEISQYVIYDTIEEVFESIDEEDNLKGIYNSIKERNQESFDLFMKNRIKEIRRLSEDYLVVVDFWALSLIKYASEKGMENNIRVVELGYTEYGDNVFL